MSLGGLPHLVELLDARARITELESEVARLRGELDRAQSAARNAPVLRAEVIETSAVTAAAANSLDAPTSMAELPSVPAPVAAIAS